MTVRTLTIPPFEDVGGTLQVVRITISLVDSNGNRIQGLVSNNGNSIIDSYNIEVDDVAVTVDIFPQEDITPILNAESSADPSVSLYQVETTLPNAQQKHTFRTQVAPGGALSWNEFLNGISGVVPGDTPEWLKHINDPEPHIPLGGNTGEALVKISDDDRDVGWSAGGGGGVTVHNQLLGLDANDHTQYLLEVQAGTNVSVDNTNPQRPIVSSTGGAGEVNVGANVGNVAGTDIYRDKTGPTLNFHRIADTPTVDVSLAADTISLNVPANTFDAFGSASTVQVNLDTHESDVANPHGTTKAQVGLGNADNTSDIDKPVSIAQQAALDLKADDVDLTAHETDGTLHVPPGGVANQVLAKIDAADGNTEWQDPLEGSTDEKTKVSAADTTAKFLNDALISGDASVSFSIVNPGANEQLDIRSSGAGGGEANEGANVGTGVDVYKGKNGIFLEFYRLGSTATVVPSLALDIISFNVPANTFDVYGAAATVQSNLDTHEAIVTGNPHAVTKGDVGLGNADNTSDLAKPISTATQTALDAKADNTALTAHTGNTTNPHSVTKSQVGLGNVDNTSDINKPISTATQGALDLKADQTALNAHTGNAGIHVPAAGTTGQVLAKASNADGDTQWSNAGAGEANLGANVGLSGINVYRDKTDVTLNFHKLGSTATVVPSLALDIISFDVPANTFDAFGSATTVQGNLDTHEATITGNPHGVTKADVGLGNVDNTSDVDKPVSTAQQAALDLKADDTDLTAHTGNAGIHVPALGTTGQVLAKASNSSGDTIWADGGESNLGANVGTGIDVFRDKTAETLNFHRLGSTATVVPSLATNTISFNVPAGQFDPDGSSAAVQSNLDAHEVDQTNPHVVTKTQVGLGNVDNTSDVDKPISTATQSELDLKPASVDIDNIVALTQAEYDLLSPPDARTFYLING